MGRTLPPSAFAFRPWHGGLLVFAAAFVLFLPTVRFGFLHWDDELNFLSNPHYRGLSWSHLSWMWTAVHSGHYIPVTWMTLGLDYLVWGMNPAGYHLGNALFHAANAVLAALVIGELLGLACPGADAGLRRLSAAAGALFFALHPLRVESVAWLTERRDVACGFFFLAGTWAYLRFASGKPLRGGLASALLLFAAAMLSKSIAMGFPLVLLILDVYPLRRIGGDKGWTGPDARKVLGEKLLAAVVAAPPALMALAAVAGGGMLVSSAGHPLGDRLLQACYSAWFYLSRTLVPVFLSPLHPLPLELSLVQKAAVISFPALLTIEALSLRGRHPWFPAAWAAYLVLIAPVSGLMHIGIQSVAERYSYLSCLPWAVLAGGALLFALGRFGRKALVPALAALVLLSTGTARALPTWKDSESLWTRASHVYPRSHLARTFLANAWLEKGETERALAGYDEALALNPSSWIVWEARGNALLSVGKVRESLASFEKGLALAPRQATLHYNIAAAQRQAGLKGAAEASYRTSLQWNPKDGRAAVNLASLLLEEGRAPEAAVLLESALRLNPLDEIALVNLGIARMSGGDLGGAATLFDRALALRPGNADARVHRGNVYFLEGNFSRALASYEEALALSPGHREAAAGRAAAAGKVRG